MSIGSRGGRRHERGQVIVLFVVFLVVLFGAVALALDYGSWLQKRREYSNVVDGATLAGSPFLTRPMSSAKRVLARKAAWEELNRVLGLGLNPGQIDGKAAASSSAAGEPAINGWRIWVASPPIDAGAKYTGFGGQVTGSTARSLFVSIERDNPSYFAGIFGIARRNIQAWATSGIFPGRFAVITLREQGQAPVSIQDDIFIAGNTSRLEVVNGDVGGNWNMKLNSGAQLWVRGFTDNDADTYLIDNVSCGNSCWSAGQVNSGPNGSPPNVTNEPDPLPGIIPDPNYALPPELASNPPLTGGVTPSIPRGGGTALNGDLPTVTIGARGPNGIGCTATSPRIGPGWYRDIRVGNGNCLVLDPLNTYTDPLNANPALRGQLPVGPTQRPGIFYITGQLRLDQNSLLVGDGVTVIFHSQNAAFTPTSGGVMDLNTGATDDMKGFPPDRRRGAWTIDGQYTYNFNSVTTLWEYNTALNTIPQSTGIAIYVIKPSQYDTNTSGSDDAADANTNVIDVQAGAGLAWAGVTYAPHDNVDIEGQPGHDGIGQLISWTFKFAGGTVVTQTYDGPDEGTPFLVEPRTGQP